MEPRPKKNGRWGKVPESVSKDDRLNYAAVVLYGQLVLHLNRKTGRCDPPTNRLAALMDCSKRWVLRMLKQLESCGHIRVLRQEGMRNQYVLLADLTGEAEFTGTGEAEFTGPPNPPYRDELEEEELERGEPQTISPPNAGALQSQAGRQASLFDTDFYEAVRRGAAFYLAEDPAAAEAKLLPWFPPLVAEFFLSQSWHRKSDPRLAHFWARQLAALGATRDEVERAFAWSLANPTDASGRKVFARKDVLIRLLGWIESKRRQAKAQAAPRAPAAEPAGVSFGDLLRRRQQTQTGE